MTAGVLAARDTLCDMARSRALPNRWHLVAAASSRIGYGHVARCRMLADALEARGVRPHLTTVDAPPMAGPDAVLPSIEPGDVVVLDAPDDILEGFCALGDAPVLVVTFRLFGLDPKTRPFEDLALTPTFDPPRERPLGGDPWRAALTGRHLVLVRPTCFAGPEAQKDDPPRALVTMGGADPYDLTTLACHGLAPIASRHPVTVVIGTLNSAGPALRERFGTTFDLVAQNDVDFDDLLRRVSVAIIAGGLTRYECIAAGTPFVAISFNTAQAKLTERVVREGFGLHAGITGDETRAAIGDLTHQLLTDEDTRRSMRRRAAGMLDPNAATSLIERIERAWRASRSSAE